MNLNKLEFNVDGLVSKCQKILKINLKGRGRKSPVQIVESKSPRFGDFKEVLWEKKNLFGQSVARAGGLGWIYLRPKVLFYWFDRILVASDEWNRTWGEKKWVNYRFVRFLRKQNPGIQIALQFTGRIKETKYFYRRICEETTMLIRKVNEKALEKVKLCA